jgi:hypothetical protein
MQGELTRTRQELENQQAERTKIAYVSFLLRSISRIERLTICIVCLQEIRSRGGREVGGCVSSADAGWRGQE